MINKENKEIREKEKKSRFNIVDCIIVLFIILAAAGIVMRYILANEIYFNAYGETFEIEFIIGDIQEESEQYLKEGETFYINSESLEIGKITKILAVDPAPVYEENKKGDIIKAYYSDRIEIRGVMTSKGRTTKDGEIMINGNSFVAPNITFFVHTGRIEGSIRVVSVKKVG